MSGRALLRNEAGSAIVEMALALPVLLLMVYGIFQASVLFQANAGMQHALGEGARFATVYPQPSDADIVARVKEKKFGMKVGTFDEPTISTPSGCNCRLLSVTYKMTPNFLFFTLPQVTLTRSKRVYIAY